MGFHFRETETMVAQHRGHLCRGAIRKNARGSQNATAAGGCRLCVGQLPTCNWYCAPLENVQVPAPIRAVLIWYSQRAEVPRGP